MSVLSIVVSTSLMPISQTAAWFALITSGNNAANPTNKLYTTLAVTSSFYCGWALYKVLIQGDENELGQYSMGLTAVATFCQSKYASLGGLGLVVANFALAIYLVMGMSAAKLAEVVKQTNSTEGIIWAWIFKAYLLSSFVFWSVAFSRVWNLQTGTTSGESVRRAAGGGEVAVVVGGDDQQETETMVAAPLLEDDGNDDNNAGPSKNHDGQAALVTPHEPNNT